MAIVTHNVAADMVKISLTESEGGMRTLHVNRSEAVTLLGALQKVFPTHTDLVTEYPWAKPQLNLIERVEAIEELLGL
jgi:hypothetical protein